MKPLDTQARELAASSGRSYEDALRLVQIEHKSRLTVEDASFALGHPVAVLADSELPPYITGTTGLGPQLRDVRIGYGTGRFPDTMIVTSIPLPGEEPEEHLLATVLHNFLLFHDARQGLTSDPRLVWQQAATATPSSAEVTFAGIETPATQITIDQLKALRVPYLTGQVVVGTHESSLPSLTLTGGR